MRIAIAASLALLLIGATWSVSGARFPVSAAKGSTTETGNRKPATGPRTFRGRNGSVLVTRSGAHLIFVDDQSHVVHRRLDREQATTLSEEPADARGENGPILRELPDGTLLAVWAVSRGGGGHHVKSELRAQRSRDGGKSWSAPVRLHDEGHRSHNFADVAVGRRDAIVSWIDNRAGQQGVQTTVLRDTKVAATKTADPKSCQCCRTAIHAAGDGTVWLAWRDLAEGNVRNIAYAVSRDGGETFEPKGDVADDRWVVGGCPESGPRFTETADERVWLAWLNGREQAIEVASSPRGGAFGTPAKIASGPVNHPEIATLADGRVVVFYEIARGDSWAIEARVRNADGHWSEAMAIAAEGRVPRYSRPLLAYTTFVDGQSNVAVVEPRLR